MSDSHPGRNFSVTGRRLLPDRHVSERPATREHSSSCYPDAGCQNDGLQRSGGLRLDIPTYRKQAKTVELTAYSL
jgi:hypothetical protein